MSASRVVPLDAVWRMLDVCAKGYERKETTHNWSIRYAGRTYPSMPLGGHGNRRDPETFAGHVRQLARQLDIVDCAGKYLPEAYG